MRAIVRHRRPTAPTSPRLPGVLRVPTGRVPLPRAGVRPHAGVGAPSRGGGEYGTLSHMSRPIFEVIALGAEDAVAAQTGGADRLELVTDMAADGLTPSRAVFGAIRRAVRIPLRVMLRL